MAAQAGDQQGGGHRPGDQQAGEPQVSDHQAGDRRAGDRRARAGERYAAGIYGTIITAAILAAAGQRLATAALAVSLVTTLFVYWLAEQYAELLGEHLSDGQLPGWAQVRSGLAGSWPMVTSSVLPLLALLAARGLGAGPGAAANASLGAAVLLLAAYAWLAGRASHLRGLQQAAVTAVAALLGLAIVALKVLILTHLH